MKKNALVPKLATYKTKTKERFVKMVTYDNCILKESHYNIVRVITKGQRYLRE